MPRPCRLLAVVLLLVPAVPLRGEERPARPDLTPEVLRAAARPDWYGLYLQNKKMGYMRTTLERGGGADPVYRATLLMRIQTRAAGEKLDLEQTQEEVFDGRPPYRLRSAESVAVDRERGSRQETRVVRTGRGFDVTTVAQGRRTTRRVPPLDFTLADVLASFVWLRGRPAVGSAVLTQDLDLNALRLDRERRRLLATRQALVKGVPVTYHEVEATLLRHKVTTLERYDDAGNLLSGRIGDSFEMRLEPEAQARNVEAGADLFVLGLVKIDRPLGDPLKIRRLVVEVRGKDASVLRSGPGQEVRRGPSGVTLLRLGRGLGEAAPAGAEEIKDALEVTVNYPAADPRVRALAREAVGEARGDREKVARLVHFVHDYIRPSYRGKGMLVLDLLEKREGDCTAYAALLTTLARAAGIPCREVSGLLYTGDGQKAFGGHAWNEVVLGGRWVPVDASSDQAEVDATHISFGSDVGGGLNLLRAYGGLSLRLVELKRGD